MKTIVATIKPVYLSYIRSGKKTVEVRKTAPKCQYPVRVLLCESMSGGQIKAEFTMYTPMGLSSDILASGDNRRLCESACLTEKELFEYMGDAKQLYFWDVTDMIDYCSTKGYRVRNIKEFGMDRPPQSWQYVKTDG